MFRRGSFSEYVTCIECGEEMHGLSTYMTFTERDTCEACGGNTTEYDADNPHPKTRKLREVKHGRGQAARQS